VKARVEIRGLWGSAWVDLRSSKLNAIDSNRLHDVLELPFANVFEGDVNLALNLFARTI
jgi:hypothetical protein